MVAGSKHPHIDVAYDSYFRSDWEDDIASQHVVMMKQLAEQKLTEQQSQNPETTPIEQSPLSLDTEISISDQFWGRRAGKEVRVLGRAVHIELSQDSSSSRRSTAAEYDRRLDEAQEHARVAHERAIMAEEHARVATSQYENLKNEVASMREFLSALGMAPRLSTPLANVPDDVGISGLQSPGDVDPTV